jgi:hypothetical protein
VPDPLDAHSEYRGHLLNAMQFSALTHMQHGTSFNTSTNRFLKAGEDKVYVVGGEPDVHGVRIPTNPVPRVSTNVAMEHIASVRRETGNRPDAVAGSWAVPGDRVDLDASGALASKEKALQIATARNEEAIWDNHRGEEVLTDVGAAKRRAK